MRLGRLKQLGPDCGSGCERPYAERALDRSTVWILETRVYMANTRNITLLDRPGSSHPNADNTQLLHYPRIGYANKYINMNK